MTSVGLWIAPDNRRRAGPTPIFAPTKKWAFAHLSFRHIQYSFCCQLLQGTSEGKVSPRRISASQGLQLALTTCLFTSKSPNHSYGRGILIALEDNRKVGEEERLVEIMAPEFAAKLESFAELAGSRALVGVCGRAFGSDAPGQPRFPAIWWIAAMKLNDGLQPGTSSKLNLSLGCGLGAGLPARCGDVERH